MGKLVPCKSCEKEVSKSAKTCPHCGQKLKGGKVLKIIGYSFLALIAIGFVAAMLEEGGESSNSAVTKGGSPTSDADPILVGDTFNTRKYEIQINSVKIRRSIGDQFFGQTASDGAIYVAVSWSYKNTTDEPIGAFSTPDMYLIAPSGTKYSEDLGASVIYAGALDINEKALSDINPGIKIRSAAVFEVSEELFDPAAWTLLVDADQNARVKIQ